MNPMAPLHTEFSLPQTPISWVRYPERSLEKFSGLDVLWCPHSPGLSKTSTHVTVSSEQWLLIQRNDFYSGRLRPLMEAVSNIRLSVLRGAWKDIKKRFLCHTCVFYFHIQSLMMCKREETDIEDRHIFKLGMIQAVLCILWLRSILVLSCCIF